MYSPCPAPPLGDHQDRPYRGGRMQLKTAIIHFSTTLSSILPTTTRLDTGNSTRVDSQPRRLSSAVAGLSSSRRSRSRRNRKHRPPSCRWFSTKGRGFRPPRSSMTPLASSMNCAGMWTNGGLCLIHTSGRSPQRRLAYSSIGDTTILAVSALSSARWRQWKPSFG